MPRSLLLLVLCVSGLGALLGMSSASAQTDLDKALVGKWEGAVEFLERSSGPTRDPDRTLIIESVEQKDGKGVARGRFGVTGKGLAKVDIEVDRSGSRPSIRFVVGEGQTVRFSLVGSNQLTGTLTFKGTGPRGHDQAMNLQKKE